MPYTASEILVAKPSIALLASVIELSLDKTVSASNKPLPISSLAFSADTFNRSILPA